MPDKRLRFSNLPSTPDYWIWTSSHDQNTITSTPIDSSSSILLLSSDIDVVGIDEAQFLDNGLVEVCNELADRGVRNHRRTRHGL